MVFPGLCMCVVCCTRHLDHSSGVRFCSPFSLSLFFGLFSGPKESSVPHSLGGTVLPRDTHKCGRGLLVAAGLLLFARTHTYIYPFSDLSDFVASQGMGNGKKNKKEKELGMEWLVHLSDPARALTLPGGWSHSPPQRSLAARGTGKHDTPVLP